MAPTTTALLVIDLQEGYFSAPELAAIRDRVVAGSIEATAAARAAGALVVEVRTVHSEDPTTWALNMREDECPFMIRGTDDVRPVGELDAVRPDGPGDDWVVVEKTRDSAFHGTDLLDLLRSRGVERIALAGISTESCVAATAADAYAHDFRVLLVEGAVLTPDAERHHHSLRHLEDLYRQPALPVAEIAFAAPRGGGGSS
ncbi:cysteine hydrolase family protein [Nocardioides zeae]|uniref:Nicotinamidase-related amidase n=1 Tax=Nocardioides zeae TaxID=1457234 RepID=A0AAJ1U2L8_9ACTN|nr:isochorismatase family cysteine hydrolase [Nocardioides zeae]MDQ1104358.1 nicotinamidase-related amidase [Nocardioides zeae]